MKNTIVIATKNRDKMRENREILSGIDAEILSLHDFPQIPPVVEDGETLEANAVIKAETALKYTGKLSIGEDTGLEIDALDGKPGVYSSRFSGPGCTYADNNKKVIELMNGVPFEKRKAKFRAVIAVAVPGGKIRTVQGTVDGYITQDISGKEGFGYDPVFWVPEYKKTFAELGIETKNKISHRAKAFIEAKKIIVDILSKQ